MNQAPIVEFHNAGKTFRTRAGDAPAVQHITLAVAPGEVLTILGPSGCGKSTLLNMAAGLFPPTTGTVAYRGQPITAINPHVGYMTQKDHLLPWRTVAGNIAVPLEIRALPRPALKARVAELIATLIRTGFDYTVATRS